MIFIAQELRALAAERRLGFVSPAEDSKRMQEYFTAAGAVFADDIAEHLEYAHGSGASMVPIMHIVSAHFLFLWGLQHSVQKGNAATKVTSYLLRWLPWLALLVAEFAGLGPLSYLLRHWFGWALLAVAVVLSLLAGRVTKAILARANLPLSDPGLWRDLVAASLLCGSGINQCVAELRRVLGPRSRAIERHIIAALELGGSVAVRLQNEAEIQRETLKAQRELAVERLPIQLLLPMAAFLVPQFLMLIVAPMVVAALPSGLLK